MEFDQRSRADDLTRLLRAADPTRVRQPAALTVETALNEVGAAIVATPRRSERPRSLSRQAVRRPRGALLIGVATLALGSGVAAATGVFVRTDTGRYAGRTANDAPGELLRMRGTRFDQIALRLAAGIPFPRGGEDWRQRVVVADAFAARSTPSCPVSSARRCDAVITTGSVRAQFADSAFCAWIADWRYAEVAGDRAAAENAVRQITGAPKWRPIATDDPHAAGGGTHGFFGWLPAYIAAVRTGSVRSVDTLIAGNVGEGACEWLDPSFLAYATSRGYPRNGQAASPTAYDRYLRAGGR